MYKALRPFLFLLPAETSHTLTLRALALLARIPGAIRLVDKWNDERVAALPVDVMGLRFRNPVGLAAGLDKNGECIDALAALGFGSLELGTVTPRRQPGNPKKRLFRLPAQRAIINRMGFNNIGLKRFLKNLHRPEADAIVGVNIGKNAKTPLEKADDDYVIGLRAVYPYADYIAINISSPNTPQLRNLQQGAQLDELLARLKKEQQKRAVKGARYVPIALKVAPDLTTDEINGIADLVVKHEIDALIATNTTVARPGLEGEPLAKEAGGLSGAPLKDASTLVIREFYARLRGRVPIIGVGGISTADDAWEKLVAGAELVQIYSTLIFEGPGVIREIVNGLTEKVAALECSNLAEAIALARTQSTN